MRQRVLWEGSFLCLLIGLLAGLFVGSGVRAVGRTLTLVTEGTTLVFEGNLARARNVAIANGKRNAVETAVKELIPEAVALENYDLMNQNIYQRPEDFIDTFRILSEASEENIYRVTVESVVAIGKLRETLADLGLVDKEVESDLTHFRLEVLGVSCPGCLEALEDYIRQKMGGVEEVSLYSISPGVFTLDVLFRGTLEAFGDALTGAYFENFRLDPEAIDRDRLRVVMVLIQRQDFYGPREEFYGRLP